jgi:RIO-like serine/threonine protein kinase
VVKQEDFRILYQKKLKRESISIVCEWSIENFTKLDKKDAEEQVKKLKIELYLNQIFD